MREVTREDRKNLLDITKAITDEKFEIVDKLPSLSIKRLTDMFREITDEDLDAVLTSQDNLVAAEISPKEGKEQVF